MLLLIITGIGGFGSQAQPLYLDDGTPVSRTGILPSPPEPETPSFWQKLNPFKKKEAPVDEEIIVEVGPREYDAKPGPLLRLPRAVRTADNRVIPPGFYLIRQQVVDDSNRILYVFQGKQLLTQLPLQAISPQAAEPVESLDPHAPPLQSIMAVLVNENTPQGPAMVITFTEGRSRFQSMPLKVLVDARPQLTF